MIKRIQEALRRKRDEKAIREYLRLVDQNPNDTRTRLKLGDLLARAGRRDEAVDQYMLSAEIFSEAGFHLKSIALYRQILKLDPNSRQALRKAARVSFRHGIYADSFPYYEKLADLLRRDDDCAPCAGFYEQVRSIAIGDQKLKVQLLEAIFPDSGEPFSDPGDRLVGILKEMMQQGAAPSDVMALASWLMEAYPDRIDVHEIVVSLLSAVGDASLAQALDRMEALCRRKGKLEERSGFLKEHRAKIMVAPPKASRRETGGELGDEAGDSSGHVRVRMEGDVHGLLMRKARGAEIPSAVEGSDGTETGREAGPQPERLEFKDLFQDFKESIQGQVAADDSETHYNLGVAYLEMDLFEDAMQEFERASGGERFRSDSIFMMGNCARSLDRPEDALRYYEKALAVGGLTVEQACAIRYEQAITLRGAGRGNEALDLFRRIRARAGEYRDTDRQILELGGESENGEAG